VEGWLMLTIELIEKLAGLNRIKIPEPMIHAKGVGAHGIFIPYLSMKDYTKANFLKDSEKETPVFVRFSKMMGRAGTADTLRDVRGFSVKFFTDEGIYDLMGIHFPIYFIRQPKKFPALIKALSPNSKTNIREPEKLWHYVANNPETMHMITWLYSDRGTIKSYRKLEGYSVHTYIWENNKGESFWIRYHWKPLIGTEEINRQEAEFLAGFDPDIASRDLADTFAAGKKVSYEMRVQIIPTSQKTENEIFLLDPVCVWPESLVPSIRVGKMILDRGVENFHEEVEKAAFTPSNLVPGIGLSPEPLLIAMVFACTDSQRYRIGENKTEVNFNKREEPYRTIEIEKELQSVSNDQLALRLQSMNKMEKQRMIDNIVEELLFIDQEIQKIIVNYFNNVDSETGASLEKSLDLW
jgi:catalase